MVTTSYPLTQDSVSGIFIQRLVEHLPAEIEVTVITPCGLHPQIQPPQQANIKIHCCRYAPYPWQTLAHLPGGLPVACKNNPLNWLLLPPLLISLFWRLLQSAKQADLIHANWSLIGVIAGLAGWMTNTPVITTLRGADINRAKASPQERRLLRLCCLLNRKIITVSDAFAERMRTWMPERQADVVMIPNGIDTTLFQSTPKPATPPDETTLITIGSLIPRKGVDRILSALALLKTSHRFRLLIIGCGPEEARLKQQAIQTGLADRTEFLGQIPPDKIPQQLLNSDLFLLASDGEGRANAVIEAMAAGLPILASRIDGMAELVRHGDNGLLFDYQSPESLAHALVQLLDHPQQARQMGRRSLAMIDELGLNWHTTAQRYQALWRQSLTNREQG